MSENILEIRHLGKSFGTHEVLRDIDFTVKKGDVISIIGASGSGKSTLLRCVNLLETPSSGQILYHGTDVAGRGVNAPEYRSHVGMVFQSFNLFNNANVSWATVMPMIVTVLALVLIAVLSKKGVRGAVLWGILGGAALYYVLGLTVPGFYGDLSSTLKIDFVGPFRDFGEMAFGKVFTEGFDFSAYVSAHGTADLVVVFITTSLAFCMVDMFDTLGTLYGACARGNMLLPNGEVPNMDKAMLADAIATTTGAICGTSTVTTFVESSAGVAEGGRTGLAAMATAALFFIAMFLSPIASLIPTAATAAALIYVGVLMINCVKDLDWMDPSVALPSFLTMAMMPFTYNISYGIAFGLISYVLIRIFTGKIREVKVGTWVITILFLLMLFLTH